MNAFNLKRDNWFRIAMIIDTDFVDSEKTFRYDYFSRSQYFLLDSGRCDNSSIIRVYINHYMVSQITRIGPDTESYQEIHKNTMENVQKYLTSLTK